MKIWDDHAYGRKETLRDEKGLRRLLRVPWTARRSNQSIQKEINPEYSGEGLMLKLSILWPPDAKSLLIGKDSDAGKD